MISNESDHSLTDSTNGSAIYKDFECSCQCSKCGSGSSGLVHLHQEIENLKHQVMERENRVLRMESDLINQAQLYPRGEVLAWQEKYERLYEAHKKVQKVNQNLEDKLLKIVDKCETEKTALLKDIAGLTQRLAETRSSLQQLQEENGRYRTDVNIAIQLLHCKPSSFVSHRLDTLPADVQQKVKSFARIRKREGSTPSSVRTIKVPIPTFPPTAMVYSVNKFPQDLEEDGNNDDVNLVSAAVMAKVLEEREKERGLQKHCESCRCAVKSDTSSHLVDKGTQTLPSYVGEIPSRSCAHCMNNKSNYIGNGPLVHSSVTIPERSRSASLSSSGGSPGTNGVAYWSRAGSITSTETEI